MIKDEIKSCLSECVDETSKPGAYPMLPYIIKCLEEMYRVINDDLWESRDIKLGAGLGKLIMDDFSFLNSELGTRLSYVAAVWCTRGN